MPEALAIVVVTFVAIVTCVVLWVQSRNPALYNPRREQARLERHVIWLETRLIVARREGWSHEMVSGLTTDLCSTNEQLAQINNQLATTAARAVSS